MYFQAAAGLCFLASSSPPAYVKSLRFEALLLGRIYRWLCCGAGCVCVCVGGEWGGGIEAGSCAESIFSPLDRYCVLRSGGD